MRSGKLLLGVNIDHVATIRQARGSTYPSVLRAAGIEYVPLRELGGLRKPLPDSPNGAWRNESFRGYADYMQTEPFARALEHLLTLARERRTAIMCAEAVPWRCHRSLIADALLVRGIAAEEISSATRRSPHKLTPFARVRGTEITYPRTSETSEDLFEKGS